MLKMYMPVIFVAFVMLTSIVLVVVNYIKVGDIK